MLRQFLRRMRSRFGPALQSDTAFIEAAYVEILGRPADQDGLDHYTRLLREGLGRTAVLLSLMRSEEFTRRLNRPAAPSIPSLRILRPTQYRDTVDLTNGESIAIFDARAPADFDWLERGILEHGYYEQPGVWNLGVDVDKRIIAEIVASFAPERALEIGCAAGAVLEVLEEHGIQAEGVEISSSAVARAAEGVRPRIHRGDLLSLDVPAVHDLAFGLDVFEHLNPNRIDAYVARLTAITREDAFFFCNIPAFGEDPVFGTVFPLYVEGWEQDAAAGRPFSALHVDELGYPIHGHLTWADARWWVQRFEAAGLGRDLAVERELHRKYDRYMEKRAPARRAFFVFAKAAAGGRRSAILRRIAAEPSRTLQMVSR
jgi:Domain of unknown function (DUF4214)/Methyltransferase domain